MFVYWSLRPFRTRLAGIVEPLWFNRSESPELPNPHKQRAQRGRGKEATYVGVLGCVFRLTARVWNVAVHPVVVENKDFIIF